ncbi:hypothetical protein [Actinomycetospora sp.]|jgi:hypothetical protein|uniref:hypothetical protein n=1 Tax=Actinomycetospora sp. TaxID=1872135 RepID=UPI002F40C17E
MTTIDQPSEPTVTATTEPVLVVGPTAIEPVLTPILVGPATTEPVAIEYVLNPVPVEDPAALSAARSLRATKDFNGVYYSNAGRPLMWVTFWIAVSAWMVLVGGIAYAAFMH